MRSNPLIQTLALLVIFAVAGIPLWSLTREKPRVAPPPAPPRAERTITLEITTNAPAAVEIQLAGKVLASSAESAIKQKYRFTIPADAADLVVTARWQASDSPNAIRLNALWNGDSLATATFWGSAEAHDVLSIPAAP